MAGLGITTLVIASKNAHKIEELAALFRSGDLDLNLKSAQEFIGPRTWNETASSFRENALLKARFVSEHCSFPVLADDSGLEVEFLSGAPGVQSSSYGGEEGNHALNNQRLLNEMQLAENRKARFLCCLCLLVPGEEAKYFEGVCEGSLKTEYSGNKGFGYDPLFVPEGYSKTFAELSEEQKNRISHRGKALKQLLQYLSGSQFQKNLTKAGPGMV
jgi:XTP/dITP diphosphohydrolase